MDIGITGLGRMGAGMAERWVRNGHRVVAHNRSRGPIDEMASKGAEPAYSIEELVGKLQAPRAVWIMPFRWPAPAAASSACCSSRAPAASLPR